MALSEFYEATIEKVEASFGFAHFDCHPDEITARLAITPGDARFKGDTRFTRGGRPTTVPFSVWMIESRSSSKDVNVQLRDLLEQVAGKESLFRAEWRPGFNVLWKGNYLYAGNGPFYEEDVLEGIVRCRAMLWQDIYLVCPEDGDNSEG
jgi:hypothetical protein